MGPKEEGVSSSSVQAHLLLPEGSMLMSESRTQLEGCPPEEVVDEVRLMENDMMMVRSRSDVHLVINALFSWFNLCLAQ